MNAVSQEATSPAPAENTSNRLLFLYDGEFDVNNGVSSYIRTIGNFAAQEGCEVSYLVGNSQIDSPDVTSISRTFSVSASGSRSAVPFFTPQRAIDETLERLNPDAVHVQAGYVPFMSGKVLKSLNKNTRLVGTFHNSMPYGWLRKVTNLNALLTSSQLGQFDSLFSVSETAQAAAKEIYGVDTEILPCPVDTALFSENSASIDNSEATTITFIGRIVARKGLSTFIDSLRLLDDATLAQIEVNIIGDGSEKEAIERAVAQTELSPITRFMGQVDDATKNRTLKSSDVVVVTSSGGESLGIVLLEAMAAKRPVVLASRIEGYSEVLAGLPESLVPQDRPDKLAQSLKALIQNRGKRAATLEVQKRIIRKYDIKETVGPRLMQAYGFAKEEI